MMGYTMHMGSHQPPHSLVSSRKRTAENTRKSTLPGALPGTSGGLVVGVGGWLGVLARPVGSVLAGYLAALLAVKNTGSIWGRLGLKYQYRTYLHNMYAYFAIFFERIFA